MFRYVNINDLSGKTTTEKQSLSCFPCCERGKEMCYSLGIYSSINLGSDCVDYLLRYCYKALLLLFSINLNKCSTYYFNCVS